MESVHIGDRVRFAGRAYIVRGFSPMTITPARVHLEDLERGEWIEADADDIEQVPSIERSAPTASSA